MGVDLESFTSHVVRLAKAGVQPLISGSMGEAIHLSHQERASLIKAARVALDHAGLVDVPIVAGTGTGSTRETIELCIEAAEAGADYTIVIASGYFAGVLAGNKKALKAFWTEVSSKSPIPVIIYNCASLIFSVSTGSNFCLKDPGASGGIDLDSEVITELAQECPNLAGVKLTWVYTILGEMSPFF